MCQRAERVRCQKPRKPTHDHRVGLLGVVTCHPEWTLGPVRFDPRTGTGPEDQVEVFTATDYDIIHIAKNMICLLPLKIIAEWVRGHSTAKKKSAQEELNIIADQLASHYALDPQTHHHSAHLPLPPPSCAICLLHSGSVIMSKFYYTLSRSSNTTNIINHILKKTKWTKHIFNVVDWEALWRRSGKFYFTKIASLIDKPSPSS